MAVLHKREDRESWIDWAIEFMRHGLWLDETITVQGPQSGADYMWGEANASTDEDDFNVVVAFNTGRKSRGIRGKNDLRGLQIVEANRLVRHRATFPILKLSKLTPKAQRWLKAARRLKGKYRAEHRKDSRTYRWALKAHGGS